MKIITIVSAVLACLVGLATLNANAADNQMSVADVYKNSAGLAGQTVSVQGKVVKVLGGIMKRNFVHVQDGTGDAATETNDLIVTSKQTAKVGDQVTISGVVVVNRDFGSGYFYPLLLEDGKIEVKK
ncbi:MAG: hypothetical protein HY306_08225 [Nitrosomonadales bacterium]|nr:hypothetical protein [Nitrosomonadales bacterium]